MTFNRPERKPTVAELAERERRRRAAKAKRGYKRRTRGRDGRKRPIAHE